MGALAQGAYSYGNAAGSPPPPLVPVGVPAEVATVAATPTTPNAPAMASDVAEAAKLQPTSQPQSLVGAAPSDAGPTIKPALGGKDWTPEQTNRWYNQAVGFGTPGGDGPIAAETQPASPAQPVAQQSFQDAGTPTGKLSPQIASLIGKEATAAGVPTAFAQRVAYIESGGRPNVKTGSYAGLFQLDNAGFRKFGGEGNITDPEANTKAGLASLKADGEFLRAKLGRDPTPTEWYLAHQQGRGGVLEHIEHPDKPAWQNMLNTAEGQKKGAAWAKRAVWGNVPDRYKRQFGNVGNITSGQFMQMWQNVFKGRRGGNRASWYQSEA